MIKVAAFNGSPRKNGNTAILLQTVLDTLRKQEIETAFIQAGGERVSGCRACYQCRKNRDGRCSITDDPVNEWIGLMRDSQGILLGSPTYFADITPEMKALIDRAGFVSRMNDHFLRRKAGAAVVSVRRAGAIHAFDTINHFFTISQMIVPGSTYWNLGIGRNIGDVREDEEGLATMTALGENMAWLLNKLHGG